MGAGAGLVGAERRLARAVRDAVLHGPEDGLGVVGVGGHIRKGQFRRLRRGAAAGAPQEGHDLPAGADPLRGKQPVPHAGGHARLGGPLHGVVVIAVLAHVPIGVLLLRLLDLGKARRHVHLARRHDKRIHAVTLVGQAHSLPVLVHGGNLRHLIPARRRRGHGHSRPFTGALRAGRHRAALAAHRSIHVIIRRAAGAMMGRRGPRLHDHVAEVRVRHPVLHHKRRDPRFANGESRDLLVLVHGSHVSVVRRPSDCHATVLDFCPLMLDRSSQLTCVPNLQGTITRIQTKGHCGNLVTRLALGQRSFNSLALLFTLRGKGFNRFSFRYSERNWVCTGICLLCSQFLGVTTIRSVINRCTIRRARNRHILRTRKVPALRRNHRGLDNRCSTLILLNLQILIPGDARFVIRCCNTVSAICRACLNNLRPNQRRSLRHGIGNGVAVARRAAHSGDVAVLHRDAAGINPRHPGVAAVDGGAAGDGDARSRSRISGVSSTINKGQFAAHEDAIAAIGLFRRTLNLIIVTDQFDGQVMLGVNAAGVLNHRSVLAVALAGDCCVCEGQGLGVWGIGDFTIVQNIVLVLAGN